MSKTIRIGTRDSELALWQAHTVQKRLHDLGHTTEIVAVKSQGDIILDKPLYELGITGIFTKTLDVAMINGEVDIAVHSMKDVPTALPKGIVQAAVLERANPMDILVHKGALTFLEMDGIIATGSLRRNAEWLHKYPNHQVVNLRGNVNTRLQKLKENNWDGAVFAAAGLERIHLKPENYINLDWMIPAPAQGAMVVVAMENDAFTIDAVSQLNHIETEICTHIERQFLKTLEGGCTAPIGAYAKYDENDDILEFKGVLLSIDGKERLFLDKKVSVSEWKKLGFHSAQEILNNGGHQLMEKIKTQLKKRVVENNIGILATKRLAQNQKQFLLNAGFWVMDEDFITINPIVFEISTTEDLLIFTSQNAVQQIVKYKEKIGNKPVLCVGEKTKQALLDHGFSVVQSLSDAEELVKIIAKEYTDKSFTFFCGKNKLDTLPHFLQEKKILHQIIEVYETLETPVKIAPKMDGILFFSPSGVSSYVKENKITNEICFCIGSTTATAIKPFADNIVIANQPSVENVVIQCIHYFKSTKND